MKKDTRNNNKYPSQIDLQTTKVVANLIEQIDNKIIKLLNCSSQDFSSLNKYLKLYHSKVNDLAGNTEEILSQITSPDKKSTFLSLKDSYGQFTHNWSSKSPQSNQKLVKSFTHQLKEQLVPLNNLRQDLKSLKLLITNLSFEFKSNENITTIENALKNVDSLYPRLDVIYDLIHSLMSQGELLFSDKGIKSITDIQKHFENYFTNTDRLFTHCDIYLNRLTDHKNQNKVHISNIVTNLQYQDIIRQKIEHIQEIHKEIFDEINSISESPGNVNNKESLFYKVKDIAGLQAAQLIHTNQEYQNAIQVITSNLNDLMNNMDFLTNLCEQEDDISFCDLNDQVALLKRINGLLLDVADPVLSFEDYYSSCQNLDFFTDIKKKIKQIIHENINELESAHESQPQLITLSQSIIKNVDTIDSTFKNEVEKINKLASELIKDTEQKGIGFFEKLKQDVDYNFKASINDNTSIEKLIKENKSIAEEIAESINISGKSVKYYGMFEKVIEEIIDHLNTINLKLEGNMADKIDKAENLEFLKKKYTTASEHLIHENAIQGNKSSDPANTNEDDFNEEDDNLELF